MSWSKNYKKSTKAFRKTYLMNKFRENLFNSLSIPSNLMTPSIGNEQSAFTLAMQQMDKDIKELKNNLLLYIRKLPRKAKKRMKRKFNLK